MISHVIAVNYGGVGRHIAAVEMRDPGALVAWAKESEIYSQPLYPQLIFLQCLYAGEVIYGFAIAFPRLSILFLFLRVFPNKPFRIGVYALMFLLAGLCISIALAAVFQCSPVAYAWDKHIKGGTCIDQVAYLRWHTVPNLLVDVVMLILPLPMIWKLNTSHGQKIGLMLTFLTGSV